MDFNYLSKKYSEGEMNFGEAIRVWKEARLSPENIREQVRYDIGVSIDSATAKEIYKLGSEIEKGDAKLKDFGMAKGNENNDPFFGVSYANQNKNYGGMEAVAKDYPVSRGREELLPDNIRNRERIKFTPSIRSAFDRVGKNLYRDKVAAKYWTLKKKRGEDGQEAVYLVAVETDDGVKTASMRRMAAAPAGSVGSVGQTGIQGTQATPTDPGTQQAASNTGEQQSQQATGGADPLSNLSSQDIAKNMLETLGSKAKEVVSILAQSLGIGAQQQSTSQQQAVPGTEGQAATATTPGTEGQPAAQSAAQPGQQGQQ